MNGRSIRDRLLSHALYEATTLLMKGRHPVAILFIELDSSMVDVNVLRPNAKSFSNPQKFIGWSSSRSVPL